MRVTWETVNCQRWGLNRHLGSTLLWYVFSCPYKCDHNFKVRGYFSCFAAIARETGLRQLSKNEGQARGCITHRSCSTKRGACFVFTLTILKKKKRLQILVQSFPFCKSLMNMTSGQTSSHNPVVASKSSQSYGHGLCPRFFWLFLHKERTRNLLTIYILKGKGSKKLITFTNWINVQRKQPSPPASGDQSHCDLQ